MTFKEEPSKMILDSIALMMAQQSLSVMPQNLCPHDIEVMILRLKGARILMSFLAEHCVVLVRPVQEQAQPQDNNKCPRIAA